MDPRHLERIKTIQNLFASTYPVDGSNFPHKDNDTARDILKYRDTIDQQIASCAPKFPLENIARTDLAVLRLAVYELTITKDQPMKVVINEAVELAKEFGGDRSFAFVNAVLGTIAQQLSSEK